MSSKSAPAARFSLRRWSQRKLETARAGAPAPSPSPPAVDAAMAGGMPAKTPYNALAPASSAPASPNSATPELPAIDSLTIDSDFTPFFQPQVDASIKLAALKQLFRDPRFNIMDGLDTYIGDYTQADPIPAAMLEDLMQRRVFFPMSAPATDPKERVVDEPAGDQAASSAEAIAPEAAPQVAAVAPAAEFAPGATTDAVIADTTEQGSETDAGAKTGKS